jgi:hypothetical protein
MIDSENKHPPVKPDRSFMISDFSVRDIPLALLTYVIISAICVVLGLAVESLGSFWQGVLFGIAVAVAAVGGLSLIQRVRCRESNGEPRSTVAPKEELARESNQPKSSSVPLWRRWSLGFEILLLNLALFQLVNWTSDAMRALEGANAVPRIGFAVVAIVFVLICIPLLAYELACWVLIRPSNRVRILKSMHSDQRVSEGNPIDLS